MLDIMRYQFRTMLRKSVVHILNICLLGTGTLMMFFDSFNAEEGEPILKATEYMPKTLPILMALGMFGATCLATMVAGDDFMDKTINHELSAGRRRYISYFGRAIPSLIAAPLCATALYVLPYVIYGIAFGWGDTLPTGDLVLRVVLGLFPLIRVTAFCVMILFLFKNPIAACMTTMGAPMLGMAVQIEATSLPFLKIAAESKHWLLSPIDFTHLGEFSSWYTYNLNMEQFYTYDTSLDPTGAALTVIVSVVMTAVYLLIGYHFFHVDDMN